MSGRTGLSRPNQDETAQSPARVGGVVPAVVPRAAGTARAVPLTSGIAAAPQSPTGSGVIDQPREIRADQIEHQRHRDRGPAEAKAAAGPGQVYRTEPDVPMITVPFAERFDVRAEHPAVTVYTPVPVPGNVCVKINAATATPINSANSRRRRRPRPRPQSPLLLSSHAFFPPFLPPLRGGP